MESIKENIWPLVWCLYMFFLCITWGFDGLAGGIVVSITEFRKDFGTPYGDDYVVSATWQLGFQAATIFGGKILTGLPLGVFTTAAPPYASEMAPLTIRGSVAAGMNFSIVLGQLIGYGVMREASHYGDARAYKVLFATQWGFAAVALVFLPFFPESPYWLVAHGRAEKARKNLERLHDSTYDYDGHMAEIHESLARQNQDNDSQGSYLECFSKTARKRTLVAIGMFFIQNASGPGWVVGYMSYYFQLAGMAPAASFDTTVGLAGLMAIGNIVGWFLVDYFGRRGTALYGSIILTITLFLIGASSLVKTQGAVWAQVVFMAIWSFCNLGGKVAFIFGATLAVCCVFIFFMVPETKDRTYIEIDELWTRKVPPRKFKRTNLVTLPNDK
ncbi:hypothetical protein K4K50_002388 [Colletotrichum sp. SAR 10_71]|nr:hypothetical protein K4K50_002388 [Colletotrichum sp. SAR 10_71]KAI8189237.1 hypothetical protein K4K51_005098 [Colletotrichum sp. SAR 10_75]KAI8250321.1 hypothetical protein K4K53_012701 [Colletotrichum sp. SAR 10_77]